jgi:hypothetical protein
VSIEEITETTLTQMQQKTIVICVKWFWMMISSPGSIVLPIAKSKASDPPVVIIISSTLMGNP